MKNKYIIILLLATLLASCTKNFEDFNTDKKHPAVVPGETLLSNAQKNLANQLTTPNVNRNIGTFLAQYWTETTYTDEANYDVVNRTIPNIMFRDLYRDVLEDLNAASKLISEETAITDAQKAVVSNKLKIVDLMQVFVYERLVDNFGNIPYTEALDINNISPAFDDAATIYTDLINRVKKDLDGLSGSSELGSSDLIYSGDTEAWSKFANALLIKLSITIADVSDMQAMAQADSRSRCGRGLRLA